MGKNKQWIDKFRDKTGWKILDAYILRKFLGSVVYAIMLLMTIIIVFDLSENIQRFMDKAIPVKDIIFKYYFNFIPYFINLFIPLFTFISVIWFTSKLSSHNEIISITGNGVSFKRFMLPYLVGSVIIVILSLIMSNFVVPKTNERLNDFKFNNFGKATISTTYLHVKNSGDSYIFIERWDRSSERGYNATYEEFDGASIRYKITAQIISYDENEQKWIMRDCVCRRIEKDKEYIDIRDKIDTTFNVLPRNFDQDVFVSETMSFTELQQFIHEEKVRGSSLVAHYQIEAHKRVANPLGIIIMTFLGLSVSFRKNVRGVGVHIFMGMGLAFTFIFLQQVSTVFSVSGGLPPVLGTWIPNLIFLVITIGMLKFVSK
ncbi:MAG: LptF/LptG family permease [Bacteroidales bacterium]|nr:LptF/LptG family permease [Bacteroidales bacterium]